MRAILLVGTVVVLWTANVHGAEPSPDAIDAIFAEARQPGVPGCAVGVVRSGEVVYKQAYGLADLERNVPLTSGAVAGYTLSGTRASGLQFARLSMTGP